MMLNLSRCKFLFLNPFELLSTSLILRGNEIILTTVFMIIMKFKYLQLVL